MIRLPKCHCRLLILTTAAVVAMTTTLLLYFEDKRVLHLDTRTMRAYIGNRTVELNRTKDACTFADIDPFNPTVMKYYKKFPTTSCHGGLPTITFYDGRLVRVNSTSKALHLGKIDVKCWYRSVVYQNKIQPLTGSWEGPFSESKAVMGSPEFVEVKCYDRHERVISRMHHYATNQNRNKLERKEIEFFKDTQMNVLLVCLDSLSRNLFKRSMPKTSNYLLKTLGAVDMNMHNKIGVNTFPNLLAILSGKYVGDMRGWDRAQGFDDVPFIWKDYKSAGYRTQYVSDQHDFDDFKKSPTDSYNLPMVQALMFNKIPYDNNCFEDQEEVKLWLNLVFEFARNSVLEQERFFSLAMFNRPTHHFHNQASAVDEHYQNFLRMMFENSLLNNTFMVFFGDHGIRAGTYRQTYEGSIEARAANMVLYLPPWFRSQYSSLFENVLLNADRLTTHFDVHETLRSILNFSGKVESAPVNQRGINLLSEIPPQRTCADATISAHFCLCHGGVWVLDSDIKERVGKEVVKGINSILKESRDKCEILTFRKVHNLILLAGQPGNNAVYRVVITTDPGGAKFEATVDYKLRYFFFLAVKVVDLSRINMYRGQSDCVANDKLLRMYCFCKHPTLMSMLY